MITNIILVLLVAYVLPSIYKIMYKFLSRSINMVLNYIGVVPFTTFYYIQSIGLDIIIHIGLLGQYILNL
jgi:hypothetical protein